MRKILFVLCLLIVFAALYYPVIFTYFSQDDFFHFKVSQTDGSIQGLIKLFGFYSFEKRQIAFYRPISRELPFNLYYSIFGLNPVGFRIIILLIHFINIYLVYIFIQKITSNRFFSCFVTFFFGITAANVATLYYLAGGIQTLLATTFTLFALLLFHQYLKTTFLKFKILAFLAFILAITSHEQAIITPFLLLGLIYVSKNIKQIKKYIFDLFPYFLLISILLILEISLIGFSSGEKQYQAVFNIKTVFNSLFWYTSWALGVPETLIDFVLPGFKLNPNLLKYWGDYYIFILPSLFISLFSILIATFYLLLKNSKVFTNKIFILSLVWFPLGLLPIILLPLHKSSHYLVISLPAFWLTVGFIIFNFYQQIKKFYVSKIFIVVIIISLTTLSASSAILGSTNYWAATRGKSAQKLINEIKNLYPSLPKGAIIYFQNDPSYPFLTHEWGGTSKQASIILNGNDALQLLYKDPTLKVFYEDLGGLPKDLPTTHVYSFIAKIH